MMSAVKENGQKRVVDGTVCCCDGLLSWLPFAVGVKVVETVKVYVGNLTLISTLLHLPESDEMFWGFFSFLSFSFLQLEITLVSSVQGYL
jgi:hypothetical protein